MNEPLLIEQWPTARPIPYAQNARTLSDRAVDVCAASIKEFGWRQPIVCDVKDVVIVGHTRLLAALKLELTDVPVHVATRLTPAQVKAYRLMDNRSADESSWDLDLLVAEMAQMQALGIDLATTGFDEAQVEELLKPPPKTEDDDAPAPPATPVSVRGDVWLLGGHRVMCGDALNAEEVQRLLVAKPADLVITTPASEPEEEDPDPAADSVFTDPPYNVDYGELVRGRTGQSKTRATSDVANDHMTREEFVAFLGAMFRAYRKAVKPTASLYVCHPFAGQREFQDAIEEAGFEVRCQIIWAKNNFTSGWGRYKWQHEPIFYAHVKNQKDAWHGNMAQSTVWQVSRPANSKLHPTMKPVELIERALANSSRPRQIVLDLFGGSGSTLIACEKTGRRARLMELDPIYVDVIVDRWQQYTSRVATLEGHGNTFAETKAHRALA